MTAQLPTNPDYIQQNLYEKDYYLWLVTTAKLLQEGQLFEIDTHNLIEEIQDMGRSEKRAVESNLEILMMHLLKYKYQKTKHSNSWEYTIYEHRDRLTKAFRDSPSLKLYFQEIFEQCYNKGRKRAAIETKLPIDTFPDRSPFTPEETLNFDYFPEN